MRAEGAERPTGAERRVLFVENSSEGTVGGSHRSLAGLIRTLDERFRPRVILYSDNAMARELKRGRVDVEVWDPPRRFNGALDPVAAAHLVVRVVRCRRFLQAHRIDLVHLNNSPLYGFMDWLPAARLMGIPCISHVRTYATRRPGTAIGRFLLRRFDRVVAVSRSAREAIVEAGVPSESVEVVYNGIDARAFCDGVTEDVGAIRASLGLDDDDLMVAMVGHVRSWKGQDVAVEAFRLLRAESRARMQLFLVGSLPEESRVYQQRLRETIASAGLNDRIHLLGYTERVPDLMNAADVVLHASTEPEPGGRVLLEGMAMGKPVVASRLGCPPEVLSPECGILFDPSNPEELARILDDLLADPKRRRALGAAGTRWVERFTLTENASKMEAIYDAALGARARPRSMGRMLRSTPPE